MNKLVKPSRVAFLVGLTLILCAVYAVFLYKLQIVEGAEYYERSQNSIVTTEAVSGARGNIMDRYGRVLVSNTTCNNLIIDTVELFRQEDPNAVILALVRAAQDCGDAYMDTLPITMEPSFAYIENMSDLQRTRLDAYIANAVKQHGLAENPTAVELMAFFRERYAVDNSYDAEEMRIIAGVRWEINLRYIINTADYVFIEDASMELVTRLMENNVPGFSVATSYIREYKTSLAAHLLGYVSLMNEQEYNQIYRDAGYKLNAYVGREGAELAFESYLHGQDGQAQVTSTAEGTVMSRVYTESPQPGNHVYLTIDIGLQEAAENALAGLIGSINGDRALENAIAIAYGGKQQEYVTGGAVAAVAVKTGEPLCIASWPTFDLSRFFDPAYNAELNDEKNNAPLFNRALMGAYAPGSTFKPLTAIALLGDGIISPTTTLHDEGIFTKYKDQGYAPTCWIYGAGSHGTINVTEAITVSCNYFFYYFSDLMYISSLSDYAARFGLGEPTGIELPETIGHMSTPAYKERMEGLPWFNGDMLQTAIGQFYSEFSPLQLANYTATIANGGTRHATTLLKTARSYDYSEKTYERKPEALAAVGLDEEFFEAVRLGMWGLTNLKDGSLYHDFYGFPVAVAAKTGTAQMGNDQKNNSVFICFAPYDDPEIAVAVVIEKGAAGTEAAPVARQVLEYYFDFKDSSATAEAELVPLK